jgi:hypothetical protein
MISCIYRYAINQGLKAGPYCTDVDTMLVSIHAQQAPVCPYHRIIHLDKTGTYACNQQLRIAFGYGSSILVCIAANDGILL